MVLASHLPTLQQPLSCHSVLTALGNKPWLPHVPTGGTSSCEQHFGPISCASVVTAIPSALESVSPPRSQQRLRMWHRDVRAGARVDGGSSGCPLGFSQAFSPMPSGSILLCRVSLIAAKSVTSVGLDPEARPCVSRCPRVVPAPHLSTPLSWVSRSWSVLACDVKQGSQHSSPARAPHPYRPASHAGVWNQCVALEAFWNVTV